MDSDDSEDVDQFPPRHATSEKEVVETYYLKQESQFMPSPSLCDDPRLRNKRDQAITKIIQHTRNRDDDVFIPYLAIHYYDRYVSWNKAPSTRRNSAYAMCCLFLALKIRVKNFEVKAKRMRINRKVVKELELKILKGLHWQLWYITPFTFLHYYYPRYDEHLEGFRLSSVINIIIQAQQDHNLARQRHSEIASSSLMAAAALANPREFLNSFVNDLDGTPWVCELIQLCTTKKIAIQRAQSRRPRNGEASTSRNNNVNDSTQDYQPDERALIPIRTHGKEVASSSAQNDQAISTRSPGKHEASTSHNNANDSPEDEEPDEHALIPRICRKEVASSSSSQNDQAISTRRPGKDEASTSHYNANDCLEDDKPDEQDISRRAGKVAMASTSEIIDDDPLAVTDDQAFSRRPGKDPMASEVDDDPLTAIDELKEDIEELGFTSRTVDPLFTSISDESGSLAAFTSQGVSAVLEITKSPILGLVTSPLSVTDAPESPCGSSSGSSLVFPSHANSSAVHHELEIAMRPEEHIAPCSGLKEEQEISMRPEEQMASTSEVTEEREIFPRTPGKEASTTSEVTEEREIPKKPEEHMVSTSGVKEEQEIPMRPEEHMAYTSEVTEERKIFARTPGNEASTTSEVTEEREIPNRPEEHMASTSEETEEREIPRRPGKEVLTTSHEISWGPEKDGKERRRLIAALEAALEALEETDETDEENLRVTSQRFIREVELAKTTLEDHPETSETEKLRQFIYTLQSLFDASQRYIQSPPLSEVMSVHSPEDLPEMSGFEASQSSVGGDEPDNLSGNWSLQTPSPSLQTPSPSHADRFNTCCTVL